MSRPNPARLAVIAAAALAAAAGVAAWAASPAEPPPIVQRSTPAAPATRPAAPPPVAVSTRPLPLGSAFTAVRYRSIFVKGDQEINTEHHHADEGTRPPTTPTDPRAGMVFNGVTLVGDRADAMIEDTNAHKVFSVDAGEVLAGGRVLAVTFDTIDYQAGGRVIQVRVGQNLLGVDAAPGDVAPPSAGGGPVPADAAGTLGNTVGLSTEDIVAKMKRRRQLEQGGK